MLHRQEIYQLIARALSRRLPKTGEAEIGLDHNRLFFRMRGQVFVVIVEERDQFKRVKDPELAARNFMSTLPFPWQRCDPNRDDQ